ncbi:unnamed protein product [Lupinus luteus]|uniref:Uncharacterized protein n=1 Tax=Lupinus luteus TaxID=3873 RepID=A0AAV1WGA1_LUPLU
MIAPPHCLQHDSFYHLDHGCCKSGHHPCHHLFLYCYDSSLDNNFQATDHSIDCDHSGSYCHHHHLHAHLNNPSNHHLRHDGLSDKLNILFINRKICMKTYIIDHSWRQEATSHLPLDNDD